MPFIPRPIFAKALLPFVFAIFAQTATAATQDLELSLPEPPKNTNYLAPISQALDAGEIERAERLVRARLSDVPEDAIAWEVLGVTLTLSGDVNGADEAYAKAVELEPRRLSAWIKRGDLAEATGNGPDALTYWAAALEIAPNYGAANQRLGLAYADAGDLPRAIKHLEAAGLNEDAATPAARTELAFVYNKAGRPADTLALFADMEDTDAETDPRLMLALGNAHAQLGSADKALALYQRGIDADPEDGALLKAKGALLVETGDMTNAVVMLSKPAAAEPVDAFTNLQYARALLALGRTSEGITAAERAMAANAGPDITQQTLSILARAYLMTGDFPAASDATTQLITLSPDDPAAWREHAAIHGAAGKYASAKKIYDEAIARFEGDAQLLRGRSVVYVRMGQLEPAAADAAAAAAAAPGWAEAQYLLGEIERARGRDDSAEQAFRAAFAINAKHWPSLVNIAAMKLSAGDTEEALRLAQQAVELSGGAKAATDILKQVQQ